jgi:hypothetical protein
MTESSPIHLNFTVNIPLRYSGDNLTIFKLSALGVDSFKGVTWAGFNFQMEEDLPVSTAPNNTTFTTASSYGQFSILGCDSKTVFVLF